MCTKLSRSLRQRTRQTPGHSIPLKTINQTAGILEAQVVRRKRSRVLLGEGTATARFPRRLASKAPAAIDHPREHGARETYFPPLAALPVYKLAPTL